MKQVLFGLELQVVASSNRATIGIKGTVIEDTRNMLAIMTSNGVKRLVKKDTVFFIISQQKIVHGKTLQGRIDERMRK